MLDFHLTWSLVAGDQDVRKCLHSQLGSDTVATTAGCQVLFSQAPGCRTNIVAQAARDFFVVQTRRIQRSWPHKIAEMQWSTNHKRKCAVKRVLLATAVVCLLTAQTANAKDCLKGAVLGGVAGHMAHHTFLGIFGGAWVGCTSIICTPNGKRRIRMVL
jgi:hypothetical protein